ncbi:MAG: VCBS repeat-containing protein, partial [Planctomycetota bacterium]
MTIHSLLPAALPVGRRITATLLLFFACSAAHGVNAQADHPIAFSAKLLTIDGNEGIASADVDGDNKPDLVAGRNWYRNGQWIPRPVRRIDDWNGYVESNGDYIMDIDQDGDPDVLAIAFMNSNLNWFENPGGQALQMGKLWKQHLLVDTGNVANEGEILEDLDGDGKPEFIVNSWKKNVPMMVWRFLPIEPNAKQSKGPRGPAKFRVVPKQLGDKGNGHGLAAGDISGDGKPDVLVGQGWYEQPADPWKNDWTFHADWDLHSSLPMIVTDVNADGRNDLIFGNGHDFGLYWWENT